MIKSSGETLSKDVTLKAREFPQRSKTLRGRQIVWTMIDDFQMNRSLQEQYTWQDIETLQWQGDDRLQWFYTRWQLITASLYITIPEVVLRDTFLFQNRRSKQLRADIVEFDRMHEDDDRRALKFLPEGIDRLLARDRMEWARKLQRKSLYKRCH